MRSFVLLFLLFSIVFSTFGNDIVDKKQQAMGNQVISVGALGPQDDFAGAEARSTNTEQMKKMQKLRPGFRLMN
uniref:Secreted protein n=1 Tax=Caenorhabditis tropicalis TaxID=1561998 RepID=A0A1I7UAX9_9PELO